MKYVEADDFVIHLRSFQGGIEHSTLPGKVSNAYTVLTPKVGVEARFFKWVLKSSGYIQELNASTNQLRDGQSIKFSDFAAIDLPLPPIEEQRRIADFLDDQVARLDETTSRRKHQIIVSEEQFTSYVSELTKQGAEKIWRISRAFISGSGTTPNSDNPKYFDGRIPWVMSGDLNDARISVTKKTVTEDALHDFSALKVFPTGTVLVAMYGATVGKTGLLGIDACVNQAVCALKERGPILGRYLQLWLIGERTQIIELASGGGQPNISQEIVRSLKVTCGDLDWQKDRIAQLDAAEISAHSQASLIRSSIQLLEERKRALITAAVTGQMDVTTAKPIGMGKWVPNVGANIEVDTVATTASIGGI